MSDHKDQKQNQGYDLDDILAEYGTGRYEKKSKVVEFPQEERAARQDEPPRPAPKKELPKPVDEIVPEKPGRGIAARLSTLMRRADHYADHMYDQAEPDEETLRAEKYIPGVDQEEPAAEEARPRRVRRPAEVPPDTPAADLSARYLRALKGRKLRTALAVLFSLLSAAVSLDFPGLFDWNAAQALGSLPLPVLRLAILLGLFLLAGGLCYDVIGRGLTRLFTLRPCAESVTALAWLFTLGDTLALLIADYRQGLPCCAVTSFGLAFALWGDTLRLRGDQQGAKAAAQSSSPYVVTLDENKWSGRPAYVKWSGSGTGFGSQLQMADPGALAYRVAAPLLILVCLLCAAMASVGQSQPGRFPWAASACFTAASSWSALLAWGLPYKKLSVRLHKAGAALAGWPGVSRCRQGGILMSDSDLFPPGTVKVAQIRVFGVSTEKAVGYTATMLRALDCGLARPFHDLLRTQGAFYREASGLRHHEGGISGIIRNQEVLVGTAAFMHLMEVPVPQGYNVKSAVFCALDGQLIAMFPLEYAMSREVNPALSALMRAEVHPILATRDFNLIPALLEQKFKLPVDKLEFPPVERRLELSRDGQEHDAVPVALLCREGLTAYSDAVVGGRRLRSAARLSLVFTLLGAVIGVCLTFYLTSVGAWNSLTPLNFLVYMAAWLVPELLIANWVNQY